jgi:hypothetical protein
MEKEIRANYEMLNNSNRRTSSDPVIVLEQQPSQISIKTEKIEVKTSNVITPIP